jgi:hypothetical protein
MSETRLTREQALRLAELRAAKGMPLSAHVVSHLLDIIRDALQQLREARDKGTAGAPRGEGEQR